jgi:hypothetical protein
MAGDIWFGFDRSDPQAPRTNDGYVNSAAFMSFGELLDAALSKEDLQILETIKESEPMAMYDFCSLSAEHYNAAIRAIRLHIATMTEPDARLKKGLWVWAEMAEPFIRKDDRYDFALHGEQAPPKTGS